MDVDAIRELLDYDPETGELTWKKKRGRCAAGAKAGSFTRFGYLNLGGPQNRMYAHQAAWAIHYGEWPNQEIDHIDGNKANNRIANLRLASRSQNQFNNGLQSNNTSGARGISWSKQKGKWECRITAFGKTVHLGFFLTVEEAKEARDQVLEQYHGKFARF